MEEGAEGGVSKRLLWAPPPTHPPPLPRWGPRRSSSAGDALGSLELDGATLDRTLALVFAKLKSIKEEALPVATKFLLQVWCVCGGNSFQRQ